MALPTVKLYKHKHAPVFQDFIAAGLPKSYPFYQQAWREMNPFEKGDTITQPVPIQFFGSTTFKKKHKSIPGTTPGAPGWWETKLKGSTDIAEQSIRWDCIRALQAQGVLPSANSVLTYLLGSEKEIDDYSIPGQSIVEMVPRIIILRWQPDVGKINRFRYHVMISAAAFIKIAGTQVVFEHTPGEAVLKQPPPPKPTDDIHASAGIGTKRRPVDRSSPVVFGKPGPRKVSKSTKKPVKVPESPEGIVDYYEATYTLPDFEEYIDTTIQVLGELDNAIKAYRLTFERPMDLQLQVQLLAKAKIDMAEAFHQAVPSAVGKAVAPKQWAASTVTMRFNSQFELMDFKGTYMGDPERHPRSPIKVFEPFNLKNKFEKYITNPNADELDKINRENSLKHDPLFANQTTNSLFVYLKEIHSKYGMLPPGNRFSTGTTSKGSVSEGVVGFLRKYMWPGPTIVDFGLTRDIIESFIISDVRMLDENFYKKSRPSRAHMKETARQNAQSEVAKAYEHIGDAMGTAFVQGKFEKIDNTDDFFKSLLNHVPVPELVRVAAQCLIKALGLDELKKQFCRDAILKYREYQTDVLTALASAGPGGERVALRLELLFETLDNTVQDALRDQITNGLKSFSKMLSDVPKLDTWRKKSKTKAFIQTMDDQLSLKYAQAGGGDGTTEQPAMGRANLDAQINTHEKRKAVIKGLLKELEEREKLFGKEKFETMTSDQNLRTSLLKERKEIKEKLEGLTKTQNALHTQIELYEYLTHPATGLIKNLVVLDPFIQMQLQDGWPYDFTDLMGEVTPGPDGHHPHAPTTIVAKDRALEGIYNSLSPSGMLARALGGAAAGKLRDKLRKGPGTPMAPVEDGIGADFTYSLDDTPVAQKRKQFKNNMLPILEAILLRIDELETNHVTDGFKARSITAANKELDDLFNHPEDGLLICAAVFAIIPAAIYALYYLFTHADEVEKALQKDTGAIAQAFEKRVEIFLTTDYPIWDIMAAFKEALIQMGINLARDLIISTIWIIIKSLMRLCGDSEKANAPYSPLGQIDLSGFIIDSQAEATIRESNSFAAISSRTGLSLEDYEKLLEDISSAFTINQMCSLMEETAPDELYEIFLRFLESLPYLHNTQFYDFYVNQNGIREFLRIIAADIDPEFFVAARNTFERQKRVLLNICGGTNEDIKALELSDFLSADELRKAMAAAAANRKSLLAKALDSVGDVLGGPMTPAQLCGPGEKPSGTKIDPYHESQRFASEQAANAIFGGVEDIFETEVDRVKTIYRNTYNVVRPTAEGSFLPRFPPISPDTYGEDTGGAVPKGWEEVQKRAKQTDSGYAAIEVVEAIASAVEAAGETTDNAYFTKLGDDIISFYFDPDEIIAGYEDYFIPRIKKKLTFLYSGQLMTIPGPVLAPEIAGLLGTLSGSAMLAPNWLDLIQGYTFAETTPPPEGSFEALTQIHKLEEDNCTYWIKAGKGSGGNAACPDMTAEEYDDLEKLALEYTNWENSANNVFYNEIKALKNEESGVMADARFQKLIQYYALKAKTPWSPSSAYTDKTCFDWYEAGKPHDWTGYASDCPDMSLFEFEALKAAVTGFEDEVRDNLAALYGDIKVSYTYIDDDGNQATGSKKKHSKKKAKDKALDFIKYMRRFAASTAVLNVRCAKLQTKAPTQAKAAPDPEETESAIEAAKDEMDLWSPAGKNANLLLTVKSTDENATTMDIITDPTLYAYAIEKPPVIPKVMEKYAKYNGMKSYQKETLQTAMENFLKENDLYLLALNEMFGGLLQATGRTGLYLDGGSAGKEQLGGTTGGIADIFENLQLTKHLPTGASQTGECFLGFFNKRVLNSQVQKLTETLNCYSPMSVSKSATNVAYIKIALDCVIRAIVVKEMMKSLFVFGFASLDDLYSYEWSPTEGLEDNPPEPFFGAFLNEEIERALKKQFAVMGGGSFETFYTEVIEEFITGMMRILYQDETMTGEEAFNIMVRDQVGFVKKVLFNALPRELEELEGYFSPKLIQQVKVGQSVLPDADKYLAKLEGADAVDYADQVRVLTNFELNRYINTLDDNASVPILKFKAPQTAGLGLDAIPTGQFTFQRFHSMEITNLDFNAAAPTLTSTNNLLEVLDGVNSGFVAEQFVEIKHNSRFYEKLSENEDMVKNMQLMFSLWEAQLATAWPSALASLLFDTKLIMLFPQITPALGNPDWRVIIGNAAGTMKNPVIGGEVGTSITFQVANYDRRKKYRHKSVLWRLFRYNFDDSFTAAEKFALMEEFPFLDWTMTGKIPASTFRNLVNAFGSPINTIEGLAPESWQYEEHYHKDFNLSSDVFWKSWPRGEKDLAAGGTPGTMMSAILEWLPGGTKRNSDFWLNNNKDWYKSLNLEEQTKLDARLLATGNDEAISHKGKTFLGWFFTLPLDDILTLDFGSRIVQYVSEVDRPGIQDAFDESLLGSDGMSEIGNVPTASPTLVDTMIKEKIGKVDFFDDQGTESPHRYIRLPIYSAEFSAPSEWNSLTWFESMYKIHNRVIDYGTLAETRLYTFDDFFKPGVGVLGVDVIKKEEYDALKSAYTEHNAANSSWEWPALAYDVDDKAAGLPGWGLRGRAFRNTVKRWTTPVITQFNETSYIEAAKVITKSEVFPAGSTGQTHSKFRYSIAVGTHTPSPPASATPDTQVTATGEQGTAGNIGEAQKALDKWKKTDASKPSTVFGTKTDWLKDHASPYYWGEGGQPAFYSWGTDKKGFRGGFNRLWYDHFTNLIEKAQWHDSGDPFLFKLPGTNKKGGMFWFNGPDDYGMGSPFQTDEFVPGDHYNDAATGYHSGDHVNWQQSGMACFKNADEARASFDEAYRNTLAPTIFNLEVATKVIHGHTEGELPLATRILNDFRENGSPDLKLWIQQREEFIAREAGNKSVIGTYNTKVWTGTGRFPWNPDYDFAEPGFEVAESAESGGWRDTFILQMFLWQLQQVETAKDLYKLGTKGDIHGTPEWIDITYAGFRHSLADQTAEGGAVEGSQKFTTTGNDYMAAHGNSQKQGRLLDMLGTDRPFPYEFGTPVYADYATLVDTLFPRNPQGKLFDAVLEPKKDIKTIMAKFTSVAIPPHSYVGKTIESIPLTASDPNAPTKTAFRELMQSFFIREQGTMITLIHKLLAERYYPQLENNFNGTIAMSAETLLTAIAVAQGDYQRTSSANAVNGPSGAPMGGFDFGSLGVTILKAFLGALASTVDPTWKTPWPWNFGIGPLTPIGVAAKLLHARTSNFSSAANTPIEEPIVCNDEVDAQGAFIKYGPLIDEAPTGKPATVEKPPTEGTPE
jgi:hypothetical protein